MGVNEKMTAIADAIRDKTGIAGKLTLDDMAAEVDAVYEVGKKAEYDAFWDAFQQNGKRTNYAYGFAGEGWNDENFKPKYNIVPTVEITGMFRQCNIVNLKKCLEDCGIRIDLWQITSASGAFTNCPKLKVLPKINVSGIPGTTNLFYGCTELETIEEINLDANTGFNKTFYNCTSLTNITVTGDIGQNGLDLSSSTKLTHDSLMSVINALQTKTSGTWTVTLGSANLNKLTDAEKAIATQKGWTLV